MGSAESHDLLGTMGALRTAVANRTIVEEIEEQVGEIGDLLVANEAYKPETCKLVNMALDMDYRVSGVTVSKKVCLRTTGWLKNDRFGSYYLQVPGPVRTHENAKEACESMNSFLVSVGSRAELNWLESKSKRDTFWVGVTSEQVKASHLKFDDGCVVNSPTSYGFEKYNGKCYGISGGNSKSIKPYDCNTPLNVWCKKTFDASKACHKNEDMTVCEGQNSLTDGRDETAAYLSGITMDLPEKIYDKYHNEFHVIITGKTIEPAFVSIGSAGEWSPCESVEVLDDKETFRCMATRHGELKLEGGRRVGEIKVMACLG